MKRWFLAATLTLLGATVLRLTEPELDLSRFALPPQSVSIVDRHGVLLRNERGNGTDQRWVRIAEVPEHVRRAFIATEDQRFYEHTGVDLLGTVRGAIGWLIPGYQFGGGSTINQQVIKLTHGRPHGLWSKPSEARLAMQLEEHFSKDEILEQYLNRIPMGNQIIGIGRASELYFGHSVEELTVSEAALLAGIPQAPSITEPRRHRERSESRRRHVLLRMLEEEFIDASQCREAASERPRIIDTPIRVHRAPRYTDAVIRRMREGEIYAQGGELRTSIDVGFSERVNEMLNAGARSFRARGVTNASAIVVANATGEILAYVGAARRGVREPGGMMDLLTMRREPGSTLKPFVYGLLFESGAAPSTVLADIERSMTGADGVPYAAHNYGREERGPTSARLALSASLNLAALDAARQVGQDRLAARMRDIGFANVRDGQHHGTALALGATAVRPIELAEAYVALSRFGQRIPLRYLPGRSEPTGSVMDPGAAALIVNILSDGQARALAFGDSLEGLADGEFGLKTGTSSGWRDAWAVAFNPNFTIVVWLGDPEGRRMASVSGYLAAAPIAARILGEADRMRDDFSLDTAPKAPMLVTVAVCPLSGLPVGPNCADPVLEHFVPEGVPTTTCSAHGEAGGRELPAAFQDWVERTHAVFEVAEADGPGALEVAYPTTGSHLIVGASPVPLRAELDGAPIDDVRWELDGYLLETNRARLEPGHHRLRVWAANRASRLVEFEVSAAN